MDFSLLCFCSFAFVKGLEHEFLKKSSSSSYKRFVDDSKDQFLFGLTLHHHYHIILIIILEFFSYILLLVLFWKRFASIYVFQGGILIVRYPFILEILDFVETVNIAFWSKLSAVTCSHHLIENCSPKGARMW